VISDTLINSTATSFHTVFLHKTLLTMKHVQNFPFSFLTYKSKFSPPKGFILSVTTMMLVWFPCKLVFSALNFSKIPLDYAYSETKYLLRKCSTALDFPLLRSLLFLLASFKKEPQYFLLTANENYSKTGVADTVPPFPQKVCFPMKESSCCLQF
jgi:hypothetical protein